MSDPVHFVKSFLHPNGWHECSAEDLEGHKRAGFEVRTLYTAPAECKWPNCMSEKEQKDLADDVHRSLYSGEASHG